jgi:DNA repair photolyase
MNRITQPSDGRDSDPNQRGHALPVLGRIPHSEFVLRPGPFADRTDVWSLNLARGCAHRCGFCSARALPDYPGDQAVYLFDGLPARLAVELTARNDKPRIVLVGPSTDPFQPLPEIQQETLEVVRVLSRYGVTSWLSTRGSIEPNVLDELAEHRDQIRITVSLATVDSEIQAAVEPGAASVGERLQFITELKALNIPVEVGLEPLLPNLTDHRDHLHAMLESLADREINAVSASYLVLRPGVREQLEREWASYSWLDLVLSAYADSVTLRDGHQIAQFLAKSRRQRGYALLMSLAADFGISVRLNSLNNPDFSAPRFADRTGPVKSLQQTFRNSMAPAHRSDAVGA